MFRFYDFKKQGFKMNNLQAYLYYVISCTLDVLKLVHIFFYTYNFRLKMGLREAISNYFKRMNKITTPIYMGLPYLQLFYIGP